MLPYRLRSGFMAYLGHESVHHVLTVPKSHAKCLCDDHWALTEQKLRPSKEAIMSVAIATKIGPDQLFKPIALKQALCDEISALCDLPCGANFPI